MAIFKKLSPIAIGFILLIFVWQIAIVIGGHQAALFPPPLKVAEALLSVITDGSIFSHIGISLFRFLTGYCLAVIIAIVCGLVLGRLPIIWSVVDPIVQLLRPVSPIAWSPFIVLWFGIGNMPAIVIIFIAAFFPVLLSTVSSVRKVDKTYLRIADNLQLSQFQTLCKIVLPASFPMIANGLHMALGSAWIFLVAGEMVGAQSGLGFLIVDARNALSLDIVMACILVIGFIGLLLDKLIHYFERWVGRVWGGAK